MATTEAVIDLTDTTTLVASLRQLDAATRHQIAEALDDIKAAETKTAILDQVRGMMVELFPDRPVRGVAFSYTDDDGSPYITDESGDVLFEDGTAEENVSFDDVRLSRSLDRLLLEVSERAGWSRPVVVDLREATVNTLDTQYGIHSLFGEPEPD
jgi:hypothetical protein